VVVGPPPKRDRVRFGARVTASHKCDATKVLQIVGIDETDPENGRISWLTPLAKALLNAAIGDTIRYVTPEGTAELHVEAIDYGALENSTSKV